MLLVLVLLYLDSIATHTFSSRSFLLVYDINYILYIFFSSCFSFLLFLYALFPSAFPVYLRHHGQLEPRYSYDTRATKRVSFYFTS